MKKNVFICSMLFLGIEQMVLALSQQQQQQIQQAKTNLSQARAAGKIGSGQYKQQAQAKLQKAKSSNNTTQNAQKITQLIQKFTKVVGEIEGSCRSNPKDKEQDKKIDFNKQHEQVQKAYESYQELYKDAKNISLTKSQEDQIKKAEKKLFECKNIKHSALLA